MAIREWLQMQGPYLCRDGILKTLTSWNKFISVLGVMDKKK
jgi:hypothetical protein